MATRYSVFKQSNVSSDCPPSLSLPGQLTAFAYHVGVSCTLNDAIASKGAERGGHSFNLHTLLYLQLAETYQLRNETCYEYF